MSPQRLSRYRSVEESSSVSEGTQQVKKWRLLPESKHEISRLARSYGSAYLASPAAVDCNAVGSGGIVSFVSFDMLVGFNVVSRKGYGRPNT